MPADPRNILHLLEMAAYEPRGTDPSDFRAFVLRDLRPASFADSGRPIRFLMPSHVLPC